MSKETFNGKSCNKRRNYWWNSGIGLEIDLNSCLPYGSPVIDLDKV